DLDEPDSKRYAPLVGKVLSTLAEKDGDDTAAAEAWDPLPMANLWWRPGRFAGGLLDGGLGHVLEPVWTSGGQPVWTDGRLQASDWTFSTADGWLYGYDQRTELRFGRPHRLPPRLASVVGPDGFTDATERRQRRFSKLLASSSSWNRAAWAVW